jgi:hypothetical protein
MPFESQGVSSFLSALYDCLAVYDLVRSYSTVHAHKSGTIMQLGTKMKIIDSDIETKLRLANYCQPYRGIRRIYSFCYSDCQAIYTPERILLVTLCQIVTKT